LIDFFPRPNSKIVDAQVQNEKLSGVKLGTVSQRGTLKKWLVRRVECIRGEIEVDVKVFPAFNYAQDKHTTEVTDRRGEASEGELRQKVIFKSKDLSLELHATIDCGDDPREACPLLVFSRKDENSPLGEGVTASFKLKEGQAVSFVLRDHESEGDVDHITTPVIDQMQSDTQIYWFNWISQR
jgi:hypothetical protein